jgi:pyruvate carboxylase subunit B
MRNAEWTIRRSFRNSPFPIPHSAVGLGSGAMKYYVRLGEPPRTLEVDVAGGRVTVDGTPFEAHLAAVPGTPLYHLLLGGASWTVAAQRLEPGEGAGAGGGAERWMLGLLGEHVDVEVMDERTRQIQELTGRRPVPLATGLVVAPMPGLVVRVHVVEGQRVEAGAGLVVVEAMKMENELRSPRAGVVGKIHVAIGQAVEKGALLVTVASADG